MDIETPFGVSDLKQPNDPGLCPIKGCTRKPSTHEKKDFKFCHEHGLRIHQKTFVYYDGDTEEQRKTSRLRNILPSLRQFASDHILDNKHKAECRRLGYENSEDALTFNVFAGLHQKRRLHLVYKWLTQESIDPAQLKLLLWGLEIDFEANRVLCWEPLKEVRNVLESGIRRFLTEPDIMLLGPKCLVCIEAKFTSGNPLCADDQDQDGEKPKSKAGLINRYIDSNRLWNPTVLSNQDIGDPVHSQLLRMLVFTSTIAQRLPREWKVVNLVSETQWERHKGNRHGYDFNDPTDCIPSKVRANFQCLHWEKLHHQVLAAKPELQELST